MRLHRRRVDENFHGRPAGLRERVEQVHPDAFGGPADIAIVDGLLRPVFGRRVDPAPAGFEHMDNAADDATVVDPRLAARVGGEMRRNLRKLRVRQPELIGNHRRFLSEAVNHNSAVMPTILWVWALALQLRIYLISDSLGHHDSSWGSGDVGSIDRDNAGTVGVVAAGCEASDATAVLARARGAFGGTFSRRFAR